MGPVPFADDMAPPLSLCVVTFRTAKGQSCSYAERLELLPSGEPAPIRLPPHVRSQLDALSARVAWMYVGAPFDRLIEGEAHAETHPVTSSTIAELERLCFRGTVAPRTP